MVEEEDEKWQRSAGVDEDEGVDEGGDVVAADMHGALEEFGEFDFFIGAFELLDDGGLSDGDVIEDAEEA